MNIEVKEWISWDESAGMRESLGGIGGWFDYGMRWRDYIDLLSEDTKPYAEAMRRSVIKHGIREGGDWHQGPGDGVPVFTDGTIASFSYRAWGDILAAIWSTYDEKDYSCMNFYMSRMVG